MAAQQSGAGFLAASWGPTGKSVARREIRIHGHRQTVNWPGLGPPTPCVVQTRASCDPAEAVQPIVSLIAWKVLLGRGRRPKTSKGDENPAAGMGPFIMNPRGGTLLARAGMAEARSPSTTKPFETRSATTLESAPTAGDQYIRRRGYFRMTRGVRQGPQLPHVAPPTASPSISIIGQAYAPELDPPAQQFVEIGEGLAKEIGIANGERVKVSSKPRLPSRQWRW